MSERYILNASRDMCSPPPPPLRSLPSNRERLRDCIKVKNLSVSFYLYSLSPLMAESCVLILGHSFFRRLKEFVNTNLAVYCLCCTTPTDAVLCCHGISGRTVQKGTLYDLHMVESFRPDIVIVHLGSNDLCHHSPLHVGSAIEDFVKLLHDAYGVKFICVCQTLRRKGVIKYNKRVGIWTKYLKVALEPIPYAQFWVSGTQYIIFMLVMVSI